ncbi:unnamed protein product [Symbiodinium sp. CCMP2592]|nr:unnamed protein product [Symbiodinium sp. CCMP2592]
MPVQAERLTSRVPSRRSCQSGMRCPSVVLHTVSVAGTDDPASDASCCGAFSCKAEQSLTPCEVLMTVAVRRGSQVESSCRILASMPLPFCCAWPVQDKARHGHMCARRKAECC